MKELTKHLTNALGEAPVASEEFEKAVDEYLGATVFAQGGDNEELVRRVQEIVCQRFAKTSEEVAALMGYLGPHKTLKLFWPSLAAELYAPPPPHYVPHTLVSLLSAHLYSCAECNEFVALWRASKTQPGKRRL